MRISRRGLVPMGVAGGGALIGAPPTGTAASGPFGAPAPFQFSTLESRSICAGNPKGAKGGAKPGKERAAVNVAPGQTCTVADIGGPGMIRHIWMTWEGRTPERARSAIIRIYWDGQTQPSVEAPLGDFFGLAHGRYNHFSSVYLGVSEGKGFNCFFPMPFAKHCRITVENDSPELFRSLFYQVNYTLGDGVTAGIGRFHAHFRRARPPKGKNHVMLDTAGTPGVYVGALISALPLDKGNWREGEIRFFIDGDTERPTITGTGWSDWFLSAWGLGPHQSLFAGCNYQVRHPEFGDRYFCSCYRFHVFDPIYFQRELRVEYQQVGHRHEPVAESGFYQRADDWCSTVYWYQKLTGKALPPLPSREERIRNIAIQDWEPAAWARMKSGEDVRHDAK